MHIQGRLFLDNAYLNRLKGELSTVTSFVKYDLKAKSIVERSVDCINHCQS